MFPRKTVRRRGMLRTKLFKAFAALVVIFGLIPAFVGIRIIKQRVLDEAQTRVRLDLSSAWAVYNDRLHDIEIILKLVAGKQGVTQLCAEQDWSNEYMRGILDDIRVSFGLDFLDLISHEGQVVMRTAPPYATGDYKQANPVVARALKGEATAGMTVLSSKELTYEAEGLAERALLELTDTPHARRSRKTEESRGMIMAGAAPVRQGTDVLGVIYGGILINRNDAFVDRIQDIIYRNEKYRGASLGTATVFLNDSRIATTVRFPNGNRALGTRVSKEVADSVLDNGRPWIAEAFVVQDQYLTAYEPIRDGRNKIIGMLYVGILKRPFLDTARNVLFTYVLLSVFSLCIALVLAFILAGRLSRPIHQLVEASNKMERGEHPGPVRSFNACRETEALTDAFNQMTRTIKDREEKLGRLNRSYMETLGFVSHELKGPLATLTNYVYLMRKQKLGPLTEKQEKAMKAVDSGINRLTEMVRHYLNLSRIENAELEPVRTRVRVLAEVLKPLLDSAEGDMQKRRIRLENNVTRDISLYADMNMVREMFENLIGNAVKYGRDGGALVINARSDGDFVSFAVRNDGAGIYREEFGNIFEKFNRGATPTNAKKQQKGTGLGLFITRYLVEAHGGKISVSSQPGEWAEFTFTLPQFRGQNSDLASPESS